MKKTVVLVLILKIRFEYLVTFYFQILLSLLYLILLKFDRTEGSGQIQLQQLVYYYLHPNFTILNYGNQYQID